MSQRKPPPLRASESNDVVLFGNLESIPEPATVNKKLCHLQEILVKYIGKEPIN